MFEQWNRSWKVLLCLIALALIGGCAPSRDPQKAGVEFIHDMAAGNYTGAFQRLDERMAAKLPASQLGQLWASMVSTNGAFQRLVASSVAFDKGMDVVSVQCQFSRNDAVFHLYLDSQQLVQGIECFVISKDAHPAQTAGRPTQTVTAPAAQAHPAQNVAVQAPQSQSPSDLPNSRPVMVGPYSLHGSVTMPQGKGPFPMVVLVHGFGPNDMDETVGANAPFRDIASGLSERKVGVVRYDKRTHAFPDQSLNPQFTVDNEVINDALSAVELAVKTPGADLARVYVVGHGHGGTMAAKIAARAPKLAGIILLGSAARPPEDVFQSQAEYIISLSGQLDSTNQNMLRLQQIKLEVAQAKAATGSETNLILGAPPAYWASLRGYDPIEAIKTVKCPVLVLHGNRDFQATMGDFQAWQKALASKPGCLTKSYPNLNHLFMPGQGLSTPIDYKQPGHVDKQVLDDISAWIYNH